MELKKHIYTSCYSKMLERHKYPNDIYIQISRTLFYPKKTTDGKSIMSLIDLNYGQSLGMFDNSLDEYESTIRGEEFKETLDSLAEVFTDKFLLADMTDREISEMEQGIEEAKKGLQSTSQEAFLKEYEKASAEDKENLYFMGFSENDLKDIKSWKPCVTYNFFLLCFEDLDQKWTERDEKRFANVKAGKPKFCHRTRLARVLNELYGLNITEY